MNEISGLAKTLMILGGIIFAAGLIVLAFGKSPFLGKLPGDFTWKGKNWSIYFPFATSILLSVILSAIFYLINRFK